MKNVKFFILLMFSIASVASSCVAAKPKQMLLIGGGLKICSSYSTKHCKEKPGDNPQAYQSQLFSVSEQNVKLISLDTYKVFPDNKQLKSLVSLLQKYLIRFETEALTRRELVKQLDNLILSASQTRGREILDGLSPLQWDFVFEHLQVPVTDSAGNPLTEFVFLEQSHPQSQKIISTFVEMVKSSSKKDKPLILVSTASSRDVFDAVSFYLQLFRDFGVEVAWLPVEASLNQLMSSGGMQCSYLDKFRAENHGVFNRKTTFPQLSRYQQKFCENPDYFKALIAKADGIFFNGGDQYLTLTAFANVSQEGKQFSALYELIASKFANGELVVAGTSAGTAVQSGGNHSGKPIPMLTNGVSLKGFINGSVASPGPPDADCEARGNCPTNLSSDAFTRLDSGGFELMPLGVFDTHFSERERGFRLIRLLTDSAVKQGIGIDENTALKIVEKGNSRQFFAIGESSVWRYDTSQAIITTEKKIAIKNVIIHRLGEKESLGKSQDLIGQSLAEALTKPTRKSSQEIEIGDRSVRLTIKIIQPLPELVFQLDLVED